MNRSNLQPGELIASTGGLLLALPVFLSACKPSARPNALVDGGRDAVSAWEVHDTLRWFLLAAAAAPLILTYRILRGHTLSWPRGELMTAVVGSTAIGLIFPSGIIDRPGEPSGRSRSVSAGTG